MKNTIQSIALRYTVAAIFFLNVFMYVNAQTVYVTEKGKKYHAKNCELAKTGKTGMELKDAKAKGYGPCAHCKSEASKPEDKKKK